MAARLDSVAKYVCEKAGWKATNLQLQKILYLAQMLYMGRNDGKRLIDTDFEAWTYGPVSSDLYSKIRMYGASPVKNMFFNARRFDAGDPRKAILDEVCDVTLRMSPGQLVDLTHWEKGAWAKHYKPGIRFIRIPDADILQEYHDRKSAA